MNDKQLSKYLSFILRHDPGFIGLCLDENGWANISVLIERSEMSGTLFSKVDLARVVAESSKKRFTISDDGLHVRAAQGHSIEIDLALAPAVPPDILFHGTAEHNVASISASGLLSRQRRHVHLSADEHTAKTVGARHGKAVVLRIQSGKMHTAGNLFFQADNGVWLTDHVAPEFIETI